MLFEVRLSGDAPLIMHSAAGLDPTLAISIEIHEIAKKTASNRTAADDLRLKELECQRSLWTDDAGAPTVPPAAARSAIEAGARKLTQGPQVREGLIVQTAALEYDTKRYGTTIEELGRSAQFTVPVVVGRNRILRTRAKIDQPWNVTATIFGAEDLVDEAKLATWIDIAGQRIGLGDWRPQKSGAYGRFSLADITTTEH